MTKNKYGQDILNPKTWGEMDRAVKEGPSKQHSLDQLAKIAGIDFDQLGNVASNPIVTEEDLKEDLKRCKESYKLLEAQKKAIEEGLEFMQNLPFKSGDAAFHRGLGNVLVQGIMFNIGTFENSSYVIIMSSGKRGQVPLNELLPISEATKVLYGKG